MGKEGLHEVRSFSKDSKHFMKNYTLTWSNGTKYKVGAARFYNKGLKSRLFSLKFPEKLLYDRQSLDNDVVWLQGVQFTAKFLYRASLTPASVRTKKKNRILWGFKHPRMLLMLPFFRAVLKNNFKFIHVIRDGREVAIGRNRNFYSTLCRKYYYNLSKSRLQSINDTFCNNSRKSRLRLWSDVNIEVLNYCRQNMLR